MLISTCIGFLVTGDIHPVMQRITCKDLKGSLFGLKPDDSLFEITMASNNGISEEGRGIK